MPKISKKPMKTKNKKEIMCASCGELQKDTLFYASYLSVHSKTGKLPYCKLCLKKMISDEFGNVQLDLLKRTLQIIDKPFLWDIWVSSNKGNGDTFGIYIKNLAMPQYRYLTWKDSLFDPQTNMELNYQSSLKQSDFNITDEIVDKWGFGYKTDEYQAFERKYNFLKNNYPEKTSMHTEALLKYIRYSVKEEMSTAINDVGAAKSWGALAKDAATAAKINPSQLSKADLTDGLSTFGELTRIVEQTQDIISTLPRFKQRPHDKVDFTILCYINYVRDLKGLPPAEYSEIYKFYELRVKDYKEQNPEDNLFNEEGEA